VSTSLTRNRASGAAPLLCAAPAPQPQGSWCCVLQIGCSTAACGAHVHLKSNDSPIFSIHVVYIRAKIRPSFFPFVSWELGSLFPFLSVLAASGKSTPLPPPLNHVRAMLLSKWSRSSTPRLASSLQSPGAFRLSHLAGAPGPLAVAASLDGTTSSHQGVCADGTIFSGSR
jgi:hypothetical protein